jgi:MFS family permease
VSLANLRSLIRHATADVRPLRHRDFRLLFAGQLVSSLGSFMTFVAVPYQVYQLTHSSLAVGLLGLVEIGPILVFAFVGGALADALDRRLLFLLTEAAFAVTSAVLLANAVLTVPMLWPVYVAAGAQGGLFALQRPAQTALLPRLVPTDEITAAGALNALNTSMGMVAGPALAGVLIAGAGLPVAYGLDVLTFVVSLAALALMRASPPPPEAERPSLRRVAEGLRYARSRQDLLGTYVVDMVAMFFGMPEALFPAVAAGLGGPRVLGLLFAMPAVGSLLANATSGWTRLVQRMGWGVILAATFWGLAIVGFGLARSLPLALVCLVAAGAADMISGIFRMAIWNRTIPDAIRGRMASIELLSYTSGPALGNTESGLVASLFNIRFSIVSGGAACVLCCAICALALPGFRHFDLRTAPSASGLDSAV